MSVRAILKDLRVAANSKNMRSHQYKNYAFKLTFLKSTTFDLLQDVIVTEMSNRGHKITTDEFRDLEFAKAKAFKETYTKENIISAHKKEGYKIFKEPQNSEIDLSLYTGYQATGTGKPLRGNRKQKLAVMIKSSVANAGGPQVVYARSLIDKGGEHSRVVRRLWLKCVKACLKEFKRLTKLSVIRDTANNAKNVGTGFDPKTGRSTNVSRNLRLHGPVATKHVGGMPQAGTDHNDTSVPVVAILEEMQKENRTVPPEVQDLSAYDRAFEDILQELDLQFEIEGKSFSDAVKYNKDIIISLATGGDMHQYLMEHADVNNVNKILNDIQTKLVSNLKHDVDYVRSQKTTERYTELATGLISREFLTKAGNLDMRFKVNREKALAGRNRKKEKSKAKHNARAKGGVRTTSFEKGTYRKKRGRPTKVSQAQGGNPLALKELINAVLPEVMLKNMGSPALNNRTGRFRNSAEVTNVIFGPRGGTNIEYTYMRNPYETFEPGGAMGSTGRDPRRLIGASIREAAQKIVGTRFIKTRRV